MKKKTIKLIAAIVLSVIAVGVLTSGIGSYVGVRTAKAAYYDNSKEKVKTCELDGIKTELTYVRTKNNANTFFGKPKDKYGAVDTYQDESGDIEYRFYYNTNEICGYINHSLTGTETLDSAEKARDIADNYVEKVLGYSLNEYRSDPDEPENDYSEWTGPEYKYHYSKYIDGYKTDDEIFVSVDEYGNVEWFTARNRGRYDSEKFNAERISSCREKLVKEIDKAVGQRDGTWTVNDEYLAADDDGKICYFIKAQCSYGTGSDRYATGQTFSRKIK